MGLYPVKSEYRDYTFPTDHYENRIYHVSDSHGNDSWSGLSWTKAKKTIMAAVNEARYEVGTTTINYTEMSIKSLILVAPGHYNERVAWSGYGVDLVGCAHGRPGKAYGCCINFDGALTLADNVYVAAFGGSGNSIRNFFIETGSEAMAGMTILAGDNNLIENCVISGDGTMTYGIDCESLKGTTIKDCDISGFATAGIRMHGGADHYAIQGKIKDNMIKSVETGADGILFDANIVAWNYAIERNYINVLGGGAGSIGVVIAGTQTVFVSGNNVRAHTTGFSHAGDGLMQNFESVGAGAGAGVYNLTTAGDT